MNPLCPIRSKETPREIIEKDFKIYLPIRGGWGYTKDDACIIDKNDPIVNPALPFNGVSLEYIFVEKRIYEEMIIFRGEKEKFAGIRWEILKQNLTSDGDRHFDQLIFEITAFREKDWDALKAEWEGPNGHESPDFDFAAHEKKRQDRIIRLTREFWFDITSFFGQGTNDAQE